jgi:hypothetical protein
MDERAGPAPVHATHEGRYGRHGFDAGHAMQIE